VLKEINERDFLKSRGPEPPLDRGAQAIDLL
jgi:hypothetical protein